MTVAGWHHPACEAVVKLVGARTGLSFSRGRLADAEAGIRRDMRKAGITDPDHYLRRLRTGELPLDGLITELTVGETYFFREPGQFEFIRRTALPEIRRRRGATHPVRMWSAGCASGEEAYSLAILIEEEPADERSSVLGTDISRAALAKARRAVYGAWSLRNDDGRLANRYFQRQGNQFALVDHLRQRVTFDYLNLAADVYPSAATKTVDLDLILCRNVMIYFDGDTVRNVARRLLKCLADGGWLVTGPSDPRLPIEDDCEAVMTSAGFVYQRRRSSPYPLSPALPVIVQPSSTQVPAFVEPATTPDAPITNPHELSAPRSPRQDLAEAQAAFARGDYTRVIDIGRHRTADLEICKLRVRALVNLGDAAGAERSVSQAVVTHPLIPELHYLKAIILLRSGRHDDAIRSIRRTIYLDRSLVVAHLALGTLLQQCDDEAGALRAFKNAYALAAACHPDDIPPLSEEETAGQLAEAAKRGIAVLEGSSEERSLWH